jgi:hypothetical protein
MRGTDPRAPIHKVNNKALKEIKLDIGVMKKRFLKIHSFLLKKWTLGMNDLRFKGLGRLF